MNITVYLALTGIYLAGRAVGRLGKQRKARKALPPGDDRQAP